MNDKISLTKISIVTPSYNQGRYLEDTIKSVIYQGYPNLEYIIIDGGSSDNSVSIIKKYEKWLTYWHSKKDLGQSDAINQGFNLANGDVLIWLNSDDYFLPNSLHTISRYFQNPEIPKIVFGNCIHLNENDLTVKGSDVKTGHNELDIELGDYILQPSCFFSKRSWGLVGELNINLHYGFDWEWFIRAKKKNVLFEPINNYLSVYRIHSGHKTITGGSERLEELANIYKTNNLENVGSSLLLWNKSSTIRRIRSIFKKLKFQKLYCLDDKLLYILFFRKYITFEQYKNIKYI